MNIKIYSIDQYKGFLLHEPFNFNDFLCLVTGRNGCGKTRLLESITNGKTLIEIDDKVIASHQIFHLDFTKQNPTVLSSLYYNEGVSTSLSIALMETIDKYKKLEEIPGDYFIPIHYNTGLGTNEFNAKELLSRAENLLDKKINDIIQEELELSFLVHNELTNGGTFKSQVSLNQLVVNYHQAFEKNIFLGFLKTRGKQTDEVCPDKIKKIMGNESPHMYFRNLIDKLFRNKFTITDPNPKTVQHYYHPKLLLNGTGDTIESKDLSSGEKIIFWLTEQTFYTKYSKSSISFREKSIVLLDEPDSHLHPQMILDFYECLQALHDSLNFTFIINTHSPTTVALCPNENIFNLSHHFEKNIFEINKINKDGAISQLLDGVTQISVNPENCRQVYVENSNDSYVYEKLYTYIKNRSSKIDPNISLFFISAGPKIANSELSKQINHVYGESEKTKTLIEKINGDSNCQQVIGIVNHLKSTRNRTVRGLIDWDKQKRTHGDEVVVFAQNYAYSIENIIYDPISIYAYLTSNFHKSPDYFFECDEDYNWRNCLNEQNALQQIVDTVTEDVLGRPNARNHRIDYMGGTSVLGDEEYFIPVNGENGHDFEEKVLNKYGEIKKLLSKGRDRPLIYHFTIVATLGALGWEFVNKKIEEAFYLLQR